MWHDNNIIYFKCVSQDDDGWVSDVNKTDSFQAKSLKVNQWLIIYARVVLQNSEMM